MFLGRHGGGWQVFTKPGELEAARRRRGTWPLSRQISQSQLPRLHPLAEKPNADVEEGHRSATMIHLANISYRLGGAKLQFDHATESVSNISDANRFLRRENARKPFAIPDVI